MLSISPFTFFLLISVVAVIGTTLGFMLKDRITRRLSIRNISRRKATVALVISGLLVGTAMISGSLVTRDTMTDLFARGAYFSFGAVDEGIYYFSPGGGYGYFNYSIYDQARNQLITTPNVVAITPEIIAGVSLFDNNTRVGQPGVVLIGADPNATSWLGNFVDMNGKVINPYVGNTGAIINHAAARDLNASVGDKLTIIAGPNSMVFTIKGVDYSFERSGFPGESDHVVVSLSAAQSLVREQGKINFIAITNSGGIRQSIEYTHQVGRAANSTLSTFTVGGNQLYAFGDKNVSVVRSANSAQMLAAFFLAGSSFAVVAGVMLIINIFVMLAEERKQEMGIERALGMKRRHLTKLFLFEGIQYSLVASTVGVVVGLGIAYVILYVFGTILISFIPIINIQIVLESFTFTPQTLFLSFSLGLLITYVTILFASWRVSKLNIIRAIRNIPEPPAAIQTYNLLLFVGSALILLGFVSSLEGKTLSNATLFLIGPALSLFGFGLVLTRFLKNRYAFTISSSALLVYWGYPPFSWNNPATPPFSSDFTPFVTGGIFMVAASVLLVVYNINLLIHVVSAIGRAKRNWLPILRIGLSYPASKKVRTGGALLMFALVMFTVVVISMITTLDQGLLNQQVAASSGGYDLVATTSYPVTNLATKIRADSNLSNSFHSLITFNGGYTLTKDTNQTRLSPSYTLYIGANSSAPPKDNFFSTNTFNMTNATAPFRLPGGKVNTQRVWQDIQANPQHVVLSISFFGGFGPSSPERRLPGDRISIVLPNRSVTNVTIIATMNGGALGGLITTSEDILNSMKINGSQYALLSLNKGVDADKVSITMKRDFLAYGMQVIVLSDLLAQTLQTVQSFLGLFQGFLGLGLIVGIAGLGIIAIRVVVERRQEIGVLRALGFTKGMILASFLLENSSVASLGILIGVFMGIDLGYAFATSPGFTAPFTIPFLSIVEITLIAYAFAMLGTVWSALRASRIPPAEALRYIE